MYKDGQIMGPMEVGELIFDDTFSGDWREQVQAGVEISAALFFSSICLYVGIILTSTIPQLIVLTIILSTLCCVALFLGAFLLLPLLLWVMVYMLYLMAIIPTRLLLSLRRVLCGVISKKKKDIR